MTEKTTPSIPNHFPKIIEVLLLILLAFMAFRMMELQSYDIFWHSKTGEYIVKNGEIPVKDPFSADYSGKPWVAHEYLSDVIFWKIREWGGFKWLLIFRNLLLLLVLATGLNTLKLRNCSPIPSLFILIGLFSCIVSMGIVRPHIFSILFLVILFNLIYRYPDKKGNYIWRVCLLFFVWVQLHGGYIFGLVILIMNAGSISWEKRKISREWGILLLCILFCMINPNGYHILLYPFEYLGKSHHSKYILEWRIIDFNKKSIIPFQLFLFATLWGMIFSKKEIGYGDFFLYFAFLYLGLKSEIKIHDFSLVAAFVSAPYVDNALNSNPFISKKLMFYNHAEDRKPTLLFGKIIPVLFLITFIFWSKPVLSPQRYPINGIDFLKKHLTNKKVKIFNQYEWGGILIDQFYDVSSKDSIVPVWIDGRADLYGENRMNEYDSLINLRGNYEKKLEKYQFSHFFIRSDSVLLKHLFKDQNYRFLYQDSLCMIFERKFLDD